MGTIDNLVDGDMNVKLVFSLSSKDPYYNNMVKFVKIKVIDDGIDPTLYFSHNCNVCSCLPDNPLVCECKKCVKKYFNPLYPTEIDITNDKINEILTSFYSKYNKLKNIGDLNELTYYIFNLNRFCIIMNNNNYLLKSNIYIDNEDIRQLINKYLQNINNIDYNLFSKIRLSDHKEDFFNDLIEIYNIGNYYYENSLSFKFKFKNILNNSDIKCTINLLYLINERLWITVNFIDINPISLDYL